MVIPYSVIGCILMQFKVFSAYVNGKTGWPLLVLLTISLLPTIKKFVIIIIIIFIIISFYRFNIHLHIYLHLLGSFPIVLALSCRP